MIGYSECTLASLEKINSAFGEYFGICVGGIVNLQTKIEKYCVVWNDGEWWHTASDDNSADRATRTDSEIINIAEDSEWHNGPSYLKLPSREWLVNRDSASGEEDHIPNGELLKRYRNLIHATQVKQDPGIQMCGKNLLTKPGVL